MRTDNAIYRVEEQHGTSYTRPRWLATTCGDPMFQLPHLADFYATCLLQHEPVNLESFLRYGHLHPHSLPTSELDRSNPDGNEPGGSEPGCNEPGDADYHYYLTLAEDHHGLRVMITSSSAGLDAALNTLVPAAITQADLFRHAARMCALVCERAQRFADHHDGMTLPGADPYAWSDRARRHRFYERQLTGGFKAAVAAQHFHADLDNPHPGIGIGGAIITAGIDGDVLTVSVDLDDTEPWLIRPDHTVGLRLTVQGTTVFAG
jgi:hypothetical protein